LKTPNKQLKSKKLAKSLESLNSDGRQVKGGGLGWNILPPSAKYALKYALDGYKMAENQLKRLAQAENDTLMGSDASLIKVRESHSHSSFFFFCGTLSGEQKGY
jgi:hypothetical protein